MAIIGITFSVLLLSKSPEVMDRIILNCFFCTELSHDNTAHDEERSQELKVGDISPKEALIEESRDHSPEAAENDPDGWRHQKEASQVDVVVDSVYQ